MKSESEWETDTEPPSDTEEIKQEPAEENKENVVVKENGEPEKKEADKAEEKEPKVSFTNTVSF